MDYSISQRSASSNYERHSTLNSQYPSITTERLNIEEQLRILEEEREQHNSRHSSPLASPLRPAPLSVSRQNSPDLANDAYNHWNDPHRVAPVSSPPLSSPSFMSRGSVRSRGSHRAPRNRTTPARFEPDREGRPLDSMMTTTTTTSPRPGSSYGFAPSITSRTDRSLSIVPSIAPTPNDQRSASIAPSIEPAQHGVRSLLIVPSVDPGRDDDEPFVGSSPSQDHYDIEPSMLDFNPTADLARNASIASNQTIPRSLFRDFDGVHVGPFIDEDIQEEDEEGDEAAVQVTGNEEDAEMDDALRLGSEYEQWFQEQWQQAENEDRDGQTLDDADGDMRGREDRETELRSTEPQAWAEPPPEDGMHFYPAPVPRELNMPKRLSRQLPPDVIAKRRSQVLGALNSEAKRSATGLAEEGNKIIDRDGDGSQKPRLPAGHGRNKSSLANMKNLPPQLRASIFFDHQAVPHDIEMKGESATATLENLLNASVHGPPAADMNPRHPDAIGKQRPRSSTTSLLDNAGRASRASMLSSKLNERKSDDRLSRASMLSAKRSVSFDNLAQAGNRSSAALSQLSHSRFSFEGKRNSSALELEAPDLRVVNGSDDGAEILHDEIVDGYDSDGNEDVMRVGHETAEMDEEEVLEDEEEEAQDSDEYDEAVQGPPTTLLAELQLRKQKLRQRNRTAVTAFPDGMHSTLLEMDAVAQIEKRRRHKKLTTLAWEDPSAKGTLPEVDDDDVPLGVLFPTRGGLIAKGRNDWDPPLGLLAKRAQEENEPLSKRRDRLQGVDPRRMLHVQQGQVSQPNSPLSPHSSNKDQQQAQNGSDHEGETLAQRTRRLRSRRALDDAIGQGTGTSQSPAVAEDFASELMSTFAPAKVNNNVSGGAEGNKYNDIKDVEPEGETLGQRRKRLQAEAATRQTPVGNNQRAIPLQPSRSMANLLAKAPQTAFDSRNVSTESKASGLLGEHEVKRAHDNQHLADQNYRSSSGMGVEHPLVDVHQHRAAAEEQLNRGLAGRRQSFAPGQFSGLRSRSSMDLLREQSATPGVQLQAGIASPSVAYGSGLMNGTSFDPIARFGAALPNFANDPKGGAHHNVNQGSMLWNEQQSKRVSMLPRQWTDGSIGVGRTYAAQAMAHPTFDQVQAATMSDMQRAKIEHWRTSIMQ